MHTGTEPLLYVLLSVIGTGTLVPVAWSAWTRWRGRKTAAQQDALGLERVAANAAREAIEATRGALDIVRDRARECDLEVRRLREERVSEAQERMRLRNRIRELEGLEPLPETSPPA